MANTNDTVDYLEKVSYVKRVLERSCVPMTLGEAVGARPDPKALMERNKDILKGSIQQLSTRERLIQSGMEAREIIQMEGPIPELERDLGKINQFIGRMRKEDTPLGRGLREHKFEFVVASGVEIDQMVKSGASFLLAGENDDGGLHMEFLDKNIIDKTTVSQWDEVVGWKVTPRGKK